MQSELERISAEIEEATRCMGDGFEDEATAHLATAATLLEELVQHSGAVRKTSATQKPLSRIIAA